MENNAFTFHDFYGKNIIDKPCHTYQLLKNGTPIYTLHNALGPDGTEAEAAVRHFYEKAERIMDALAENESKES